ncbi:MAG: hypothetical protein ACK5ZH_00155 [Alphaproteobacteria bacterium]|jgi:hypothetical protein
MSPAKQALLYGGLGTGIGAIVETSWQIIANWINKNKQPLNKGNIVGFAITIGALSGVIGYFTGRRENKKYDQPRSFNAEETKNAIKSVIQDQSVMDALLNAPKPTPEDIRNIAKEAVHRSPAAQALIQRANKLDPEAKKDFRNYMQGLKKAVAKIDTKKSSSASWEESVKATEVENLVQR